MMSVEIQGGWPPRLSSPAARFISSYRRFSELWEEKCIV
jgi:hypothetical protein